MIDNILQPPAWIDQPGELESLAENLNRQSMVAVDTESNSLFAYREQVCLIQFSIPEKDYLVDPLALPDLSSLGNLFANPHIEKIFHAAEYDIMCLKRDFNYQFNNIFDTMQAARILGRPNVGLANMLEAELDVKIEKKYQRANWGERPLPPAMLAYARIDSRYLIELRHILFNELQQKGLLDLALEDFTRLTQVEPASSEHGAPLWWRIAGSQELTSTQQAGALQALLEYRDQQAQRYNLPHFKVLSNETLVKIASEMPTTWEALADVPNLSARNRERHAEGLLKAVKRGLTMQPPKRHTNHRRNDAEMERLENLRKWRKEIGNKQGVDSDVILPRDIMEEISYRNPDTSTALQVIMKDVPWRYEKYADQILAVLHQKERK